MRNFACLSSTRVAPVANVHASLNSVCHTDRRTDRRTDRQTDRQTDRHTHTHRDDTIEGFEPTEETDDAKDFDEPEYLHVR